MQTALLAGSLSLAAAASWGAADFSGGFASKKASAFGTVVVAHGTGLIFISLLALTLHDPAPTRIAAFWGAAAGIAGGIGLASLYRALAIGQMGINAPIAAVLTALLPVLLGIRTEGRPSATQFAGFAIALFSIWLMSTPAAAFGRPRGLGLAVIAGFGFGCFLIFSKFAGQHSALWPLAVARIASLLLMLAILTLRREPLLPQAPGAASLLKFMIIAGLLDSIGNALYVAATRNGRLDIAAVLSSFYPASTVVLARLILGERLSRLQLAGVAAALTAIPLIVR
jgi:drug/metabolite transporter (DMT)-like permease